MQYSPLDQVQQRVKAGQALPFNIFDHDRTLLLARGQRVETHEQLQALFSRGALVFRCCGKAPAPMPSTV